MAIALDKQAVNNSTASTVVVTIAATAPGALLVAAISFATASSQTITGVTDSAGNTWTALTARFQSGTNSYFQYWYATNAASVTSVTATGSSTAAKGMNVTSWTGAQPLAFEQEAGTGAAASTTMTASAVTTTNATTLVIKGGNHNGSAAAGTLSWTGGTALTKPTGTSTGQSQDVAYKLYTSSGQNEATSWTIVSGAYGTSTAVFYEPAAPTAKSASDSATMTDAVSGTALSTSDSGALTEATGPVALQTADTGALTDTPGPIALSASDAGALTDTAGPLALQGADSEVLSEGTALTQLTSLSASDSAALTEQTSVVPITQPGVIDVRGYTDRDDDPRWRYWWLQEPVRRRERAEPVEPEPLRRRRQKVNIDAELRPRPVDEAEELLLLGVL